MNKLDDFEKYLRDQLKGHAEPETLMWNRLNDAIGRVQPWYARSAFKYAFTAIGAMVFGAVSSYLYLDQQDPQTAQTQKSAQIQKTTQSTLDKLVKGSNEQALQGTFATPVSNSSIHFLDPTLDQIGLAPTFHLDEAFLPNNEPMESLNSIPNEAQRQFANPPIDQLALLAAGQINIPKQTLQNHPQVVPLAGRFELSLATGNTWSNLPNFDYHLGPQGMQHAGYRQQQSPLLAVQARVYKNWHLQAGAQLLQTTLEEHFYHTDVFSYDDEEHYLFPYLYGFRQVSDEELHEGPWPYGPNIPVGPEISKVKADYSSVVNQQKLVLPVTLSYHQQFGPFEAQLHAGLAFSFATKTSQTLVVPGYLPSTIYLQSQNGRLQTFAQSQVRLSYKANRHLSIFVEPQLRSSIRQQNLVHASPYRYNSKAIFAGLSWNF
jgi:hypothetical protein